MRGPWRTEPRVGCRWASVTLVLVVCHAPLSAVIRLIQQVDSAAMVSRQTAEVKREWDQNTLAETVCNGLCCWCANWLTSIFWLPFKWQIQTIATCCFGEFLWRKRRTYVQFRYCLCGVFKCSFLAWRQEVRRHTSWNLCVWALKLHHGCSQKYEKRPNIVWQVSPWNRWDCRFKGDFTKSDCLSHNYCFFYYKSFFSFF